MAPPDAAQLERLHAAARAAGRECVVSAIIVDPSGRAFVQRRAADRALFPGCWDIAGGHVEPGETLRDALAREIREETGWSLRRIRCLVDVVDWEAEADGQLVRRRELNFLVDVDGDLAHPRLETERFSEFRWIGPVELHVLRENRRDGDTVITDLVRRGLALAAAGAA